LSEALEDTAAYVKKRQEIDAANFERLKEGLARSRASLMMGIEDFLGMSNEELDKALDRVRRFSSVFMVIGSCV